MKYALELESNAKKTIKEGNAPIEKILKTGDSIIAKAIKDSE